MKRSIGIALLAAVFLLHCSLQRQGIASVPHFPPALYEFKDNPPGREKILLGRLLFYDPILSKDSSVSCASCHSPYNAFSHTDHALSHGIGDSMGKRNAPALFNLAWQKEMMWDGAIHHLDQQALAPITHPKEMGEELNRLLLKLKRSSLYNKLFQQAFSDGQISGEHLLKALAAFELQLISANSKYDRVKQGKESFSDMEQKGYELFQKHCNTCHSEPLFSSYGFASNGLPFDEKLKDYGRYGITQKREDSLKFKIPSLRNLSFTYPYMHDGRFKSLAQVLKYYSTELRPGASDSPALKEPLHLSSHQITELSVFLLTLNDKSFVFNPKLAYPKEEFKPNEGKRKP